MEHEKSRSLGRRKARASKGQHTSYLCDKEGHMIKFYPSLKIVKGTCLVESEDGSDLLMVNQLGTIYD